MDKDEVYSWKVYWTTAGKPEAHILWKIGKGGFYGVQYNYKGEVNFYVNYGPEPAPKCPQEIIDVVYALAVKAGFAKPRK